MESVDKAVCVGPSLGYTLYVACMLHNNNSYTPMYVSISNYANNAQTAYTALKWLHWMRLSFCWSGGDGQMLVSVCLVNCAHKRHQ